MHMNSYNGQHSNTVKAAAYGTYIKKERKTLGFPWWSRGQDSMFPMQGFHPWSGS